MRRFVIAAAVVAALSTLAAADSAKPVEPQPPSTAPMSAAPVPDCECRVADTGKSRRRTAFVVGGASAAVVTASLFYSNYEQNKFNRGSYDTYEEAIEARDRAYYRLRYVGTGMFAVGTIGLGVAAYLYFTAPDSPEGRSAKL